MLNFPKCYTYNELSDGICQSCSNFLDKKDYVFRSAAKEKGERFEVLSQSHVILICYEGSLRLSLSKENSFEISAGHMLLIPQKMKVDVEVLLNCDLVFMKFDTYVNVCPYISSSTYKKYLDDQDYTFYQLELNDTMKNLTKLFIEKIKLGPACLLYHKTKKLDFFSFLSMCYTDKEIARLLYPLLDEHFMITELLHKYADQVNSVNELIEYSGMSRSAFYQKFKEIYGVTAKQWLLQRKAERVKQRLLAPNPIIKEIRYEFGFGSASQFHRFCTTYLGASSSDIIKSAQKARLK